MCSYYFCSVRLLSGHLLGNGCSLTVDHMFSVCILTICNISYLPFGFWGWLWVLIASVPDLCILFTLIKVFYSTLFIDKTPRTQLAREPGDSYIDQDA